MRTAEHIDNPDIAAQLDAIFDAAREPLAPEDIADLVAYVTSRPRHINLRQAIVVPTRRLCLLRACRGRNDGLDESGLDVVDET